MGSTWSEILAKLRIAPQYVASFAQIYPDGIQVKNVRDAIALFERSLTTPNSRFDRSLRGDQTALTADEKEGCRKFKSYGCKSSRFRLLEDYDGFADQIANIVR